MNEHSTEPEDVDSAMKDLPGKRAGNTPKPVEKSGYPARKPKPDNARRNPDDVKDASAQNGKQPLAGA